MKTKMVACFFRSICLLASGLLLGAVATPAQTASPDVGLVTNLAGAVTYWNQEEQKKPAPAQALMKVRRGDRLKLAGAAALTLLYFASGRQETWKGPVTLMVGDLESVAAKGQKPLPQPEVRILPTKVTKRIEGAPRPLPRSRTRYSGVIQTMAPRGAPADRVKAAAPLSEDARAKIKEAERIYQDLKKRAAADDLTPELYFLGVLADYQQYPEMDKILEAMLQKQPGDATLEELRVWVRSRP
jgi:hypothetical protein